MIVLAALILSACSRSESAPVLQITTLTGIDEPLAIIDNCPSVRSVSLHENERLLWSVEQNGPAPNSALIEMRLGGEPNGWTILKPLDQKLSAGSIYQLSTQPNEGQLLFSIDDLAAGEGFSEQGNDALVRADVATPCSTSSQSSGLWFRGAILVLVALLILALVATAFVKLLQLAVSSRR